MEDFATVIWVVIIAGEMVFNVVSQSRKARGTGAHAPGHEEAWPSQAHPAAEAAPRPAPQPVAPVFPDECQSLEEIPAAEYAPEYTGHLRHQTVIRLVNDAGNDEIAAHSLTNDVPDTAATSLTGEFDLRQAVIYSEILKPKFEE